MLIFITKGTDTLSKCPYLPALKKMGPYITWPGQVKLLLYPSWHMGAWRYGSTNS